MRVNLIQRPERQRWINRTRMRHRPSVHVMRAFASGVSLACVYASVSPGKKSSLQLQHQIIHRPGEATGSWWSGSAKHANWRRQSAAAESQRSQMPPSTCHVFQEGHEGEIEGLAKIFSSGANLTHVFGTPYDFRSLSWMFRKWGGFSFRRIRHRRNGELAPTAGHVTRQRRDFEDAGLAGSHRSSPPNASSPGCRLLAVHPPVDVRKSERSSKSSWNVKFCANATIRRQENHVRSPGFLTKRTSSNTSATKCKRHR